ncbi:MAG TPA: copper ion binding protein, partial [Burkholderiales bacterium]|nr:copper ion binding protein [Burkholderiales bacterium]
MNQYATSADQHARLVVPGMGSDHCAGIVSTSLKRLAGVTRVRTSVAAHRVEVDFDPHKLDAQALKAAVERAGYDVAQLEAGEAGGERREARLTVPGMGSDHCTGIVSESIRRLPGVGEVRTNIASHKVAVRFDPSASTAQALRDAVERAGYEVTTLDEGAARGEAAKADDTEERYLAQAWKRLWIAAVPTTLIMLLMGPHMFWQPVPGYLAIVALLAFPVVFLYGGFATHRSAWRSLTNRTANMDVLISLGSLPPYLIGLVGFVYPMTSFIEMAATIMTFHLLGRYLEARAKGRASQAIRKLVTLGAKTATVLRGAEEVEVPVAELQVGDVMLVRPGAKVPTDGEILEGTSHLDESIATGESVPVEKGAGDRVIGATINKEGLLKVRATKVGADTFLAQVIRLVE